VRVLTRTALERVLGFEACMREMRRAMIATSQRNCVLPLRQFMAMPGRPGKLGLMPGYIGGDGECFGVKIVSKFERPPGDPHSSHVGAVLLFDADNGLPLALLDGATLTAIRTASMTALATDTLARPDARRLLIVGTGEEAWYHARALLHARPFEEVSIWGRQAERAAALAARLQQRSEVRFRAVTDLADACASADVICTVTSAKEPVLRGEWLRDGVHLNLVGSAIATTAEVDGAAVARGRFFVDYREAALAAAGELLAAIRAGLVTEAHIVAEIGAVLAGTEPGRRSPGEITIYKSLGVTTQDLAAGWCAWREAEAAGLGSELDLND
jgi:ornithine cyclodeaminase/alanine dehydrogenase-like protein (mu-crystallin family)